MKIYEVVWSEKKCINIEANSVAEAQNIVMSGEYEEGEVGAEIDSVPIAYEMNSGNSAINK